MPLIVAVPRSGPGGEIVYSPGADGGGILEPVSQTMMDLDTTTLT